MIGKDTSHDLIEVGLGRNSDDLDIYSKDSFLVPPQLWQYALSVLFEYEWLCTRRCATTSLI